MEDFLVPLVLQDKLFYVDEFLVESSQHQKDLVSFLDSVLGDSAGIEYALDRVIMYLWVFF